MTRLDGTVIGKHYGLMNYTIGQRKGLGIERLTDLMVRGLSLEKS